MIPIQPGAYAYPRVSPDGKRLAITDRSLERDIWIWDFERETLSRFTFDVGSDIEAIWTPDGQRLVFSSTRAGQPTLFWKRSDGTGAAEQLTSSAVPQWVKSVTPDGRFVTTTVLSDSGHDIGLVALDGEPNEKMLVATEFGERNGEISPDGRFIAYESDLSGRLEIYVRPFPDVDGLWQISRDGGRDACWGPDGKELFYLALDNRLMVAPVQTAETFRPGSPTRVLDQPYVVNRVGRGYDIAPDGRILMLKALQSAGASASRASLTIVLNWSEELKRLVPADD